MEDMAGFDAMAGLIPMVVGAGVVMKVTDSMLGNQQQPKTRKRSKSMARNKANPGYKIPKLNGTTKGLNKRLFSEGQGVGKSARKTAKKIGNMANPVTLSGNNSDPSKTGIFKAVKKSGKKGFSIY